MFVVRENGAGTVTLGCAGGLIITYERLKRNVNLQILIIVYKMHSPLSDTTRSV